MNFETKVILGAAIIFAAIRFTYSQDTDLVHRALNEKGIDIYDIKPFCKIIGYEGKIPISDIFSEFYNHPIDYFKKQIFYPDKSYGYGDRYGIWHYGSCWIVYQKGLSNKPLPGIKRNLNKDLPSDLKIQTLYFCRLQNESPEPRFMAFVGGNNEIEKGAIIDNRNFEFIEIEKFTMLDGFEKKIPIFRPIILNDSEIISTIKRYKKPNPDSSIAK